MGAFRRIIKNKKISIATNIKKLSMVLSEDKLKVLNAFSIKMLPELEDRKRHTVTFEPISTSEAEFLVKRSVIESYIGHGDTAAILSDLLKKEIPFHRGFAKLNFGDKALIAQFGQRLPEGTKKLPKDAKLDFFIVSLV